MPSIITREIQEAQTKTITLPTDLADKAVSAIERLLACPVNVPEEDIPALKDVAARLKETPVNIIF